jgi:tyrosyl-tRNA synthetase
VQQGGISVDGEKVTDVSAVVNAEALGKGIVIKKGKKVYHRITL